MQQHARQRMHAQVLVQIRARPGPAVPIQPRVFMNES